MPIFLTSDDLRKLQKKEIGYGTDGFVFQFGRNELIKIYHLTYHLLKERDFNLYGETKIFDKNNYLPKKYEELINYYQYTDEDIKLRSKDAMKLAIARRTNVKRTRLPKNEVYVDRIFAGCVLDRSRGVQIHKLTGCPLEYKKSLMLEIITSVAELLDNYIYHIDLSNSPFYQSYVTIDNQTKSVGHSHVLVNLFTNATNIIDLEGKSTIYTERHNDRLYQHTLNNLSILITEFLLKIDHDLIEDRREYVEQLYKIGLKDSQIDKIIPDNTSLEQLESFVKSL